ncbi:DNA polymerase subunit beta [Methanobrevibacter filiformis]|uniref:Polymerase nucleotidyl transferase domain-containing protein n=1 Tax=Methanobrevibacter filiformis TaxID=55758 RepID=A0A166APB3_9EURY|nr:DNA polymerase subunit beta [Methanobrevibacter filiformis]KZX12296.1 hypothetical protein MBFIL_11630 [Methanobrevibacter filiformis]
MKVRTRDFIYTKDDLYFATTNYIHPENRFIAFLRYIPNENGDREKNGKKYSKVDSSQAYKYLREKHPEYLYFCNITNVEMMGVPHTKIQDIIKPENRLKKILEEERGETDELKGKLIDLAKFFHYKAGIDYNDLGISGSILPNLQKRDISDLDFVVYGLENHRIAIKTFKQFKDTEVYIEEIDKNITLNSIDNSYWDKLYNKRIKDSSLTKEEFSWYENRKNNRGVIDNTLFDILATKNWSEITGKWGDTKYTPLGIAKIEAKVKNSIGAYDNPATYSIEDVKLLEGKNYDICEVASFTHTYSGQAIENEVIIAKGKVEKVETSGKPTYYRIVVGTTRESINEYIKLKDSPV